MTQAPATSHQLVQDKQVATGNGALAFCIINFGALLFLTKFCGTIKVLVIIGATLI